MSFSVADLALLLRCKCESSGKFELTNQALRCLNCGNHYQIESEIVNMLQVKS